MKSEAVDESWKKILDTGVSKCEAQLCMAALTGEEEITEFQRVVLSRDLASEFSQFVEQRLGRLKKALDTNELVLHVYEPGAKLDAHEIEHLDLKDYQAIAQQIKTLSNLEGLENFREEEQFLRSLRFYVIVIRPQKGEPIFCFRTYSPKKEISHSNFLAATLSKGHYDRFTNHVFLFDQKIDCICRGNDMFILNKDNFQRIFRFYELLVATARKTLKFIEARVPIDDFEAFRETCEGHLQKLAKLKNIAAKPYFRSLSLSDMKRVIKRCKLSIQTVGKGRNEKLHFDTSDKWAILRLLDDDYLESVMTKKLYEVNSKRPIG